MSVKIVNSTWVEVEDAMVAMAAHLPPEVVIGRPLVARRDEDGPLDLLSELDDGNWVSWDAFPGEVQRWLPVPPAGDDGRERVELTVWRRGAETSREVLSLG